LTANIIYVTNGGSATGNVETSQTGAWTYASNTFGIATNENTFYANTINVGITSALIAWETTSTVDTKIPVNTVSGNWIYFGVNVPAATPVSASGYTATIDIISNC
jgi:hypothetical protein